MILKIKILVFIQKIIKYSSVLNCMRDLVVRSSVLVIKLFPHQGTKTLK